MKSLLLRAGLLTCLTLGLFYQEASAESDWFSRCDEIKPNENPSFQQVNCLLTNAALEADIPPEVVKAVATQENGWRQFDKTGEPVISIDGGIGLMQITNQPTYDQQKLQNDIYYNIEAGIEILNSMYDRTDLPKIKGAGRQVIENWYFPVMAYNGIKPLNSPLYQLSGEKNKDAYQEKVFDHLEQHSFLNDTTLGQFPFKTADFQYDPNSNKNIEFSKKKYTLTDQMHATTYLFKKEDKVIVTRDNVNLRLELNTSQNAKKLAKNTTLIINGTFSYDSNNQFVWYPVKTEDLKPAGYISSAYITKKLDPPSIKTVDDNDTLLSGKASANGTIQIMSGKTRIGSTTTDTKGNFKAKIRIQKAGTKLTVTFKDQLNAISPSKTIKVIDKTRPKPLTINSITKKTKTITGKTEAYAIVQLKVGSEIIGSKKADKYGKFKISIKPQKTGTKVTGTAKDAAGNTSSAATAKVK